MEERGEKGGRWSRGESPGGEGQWRQGGRGCGGGLADGNERDSFAMQ